MLPVPGDTFPVAFARQVAEQPDALAVLSPSGLLTYEELDRRSNGVAAAILDRGVPAGALVAVVLEHDLPGVIGILGVLKTGHAYVAFDPTYPEARLRQVVDLAKPGAVVHQASTADLAVRLFPGIAAIGIDDIGEADHPSLDFPDTTLAAVVFTSGSTGVPKGVMHAHWGIVGEDLRRRYFPGERRSLLSSFSFMGSFRSLFGPLVAGGTTCPYDIRGLGLAGLPAWLRRERLTSLATVPSLYRALGATLGPGERLDWITEVALHGELITQADVALHRSIAPDAVLAHGLGSSEAYSITRSYIHRDTDIGDGPVSVGAVVAPKEVRLEGQDGAVVADGEVGEIVVRGERLALGYWGDPARTATQYGVDPDGMRTYRTGDLGRLRPDGTYEFHGRIDHVVKVRGVAVASVEVEHALRTLPGVADGAVGPAIARDGSTRLVASVVPVAGARPTAGALRAGLGERLPPAMVPSSFELVEALPRNPRGKLDRAALADVPAVPAALSTDYAAPRSEQERWLADAWASVLKVARVGIHDDLYELGGDSLTALELSTIVSERVGHEVPVSVLGTVRTVAALADWMANDERRQGARRVVTVTEAVAPISVVCFPGAGGSAFEFRALAEALGPDVPLAVVEPRGMHDRGLVDRTIEAGAARAVADLARAGRDGPIVLLGFSNGALLAYEVARRLVAAGRDVRRVVLLDMPVPGSGMVQFPDPEEQQRRTLKQRLAQAVVGPVHFRGIGHYRLLMKVAGRTGRRYRPGPLTADLLVVRSEEREVSEPTLHWRSLVDGHIDLLDCPGPHRMLLRPPAVGVLAEELSAWLRRAGASEAAASPS